MVWKHSIGWRMASAKSARMNSMLNGWPLFFLIAALNAALMTTGFLLIGVATAESTVDMIRLSVQISTPWIYITFAASPLAQLFPGGASRWLLRNRRYLGLSFAAGMGWQLVCIAVLFGAHAQYYWEELHVTSDLVTRVASYGVLLALTITSFLPVRRRMRQQHWRWLHLLGVWYLWAAIWVSYTEIAFATRSPPVISYVYFTAGSISLILRIAPHLTRRTTRARTSLSG
jgi:sulfoxide reductase heme-binding subunit YedZ